METYFNFLSLHLLQTTASIFTVAPNYQLSSFPVLIINEIETLNICSCSKNMYWSCLQNYYSSNMGTKYLRAAESH